MHNFKDYLNFSPNAADNAYRLRQLALQEALLAEAKKKKAKKDSKKSKDADEKDEKADKDYDGDGTVESGKEEYFGSRDKAIKKAISKKKGNLKETNSGKMTYGGFPRVINEVKYDIPAQASDIPGNLGAVGIDEFERLMKSGSHPLMSGQTENGPRGVPPEIRDLALMHINTLKNHPQGKVEGYNKKHPIYQEGLAAHQFFKDYFPDFGVEDQIADEYALHSQDLT
jgi:hypothetical protein